MTLIRYTSRSTAERPLANLGFRYARSLNTWSLAWDGAVFMAKVADSGDGATVVVRLTQKVSQFDEPPLGPSDEERYACMRP